ncbi:MAG: M3 family metallopeptidase [Puniceicoccaceae bacterium]
MDWELSSYFTEFGSPSYEAYKRELEETLAELGNRAAALLAEDLVSLNDWETLVIDYEHVLANFSHLGSYIGCLVSADAKNDAYSREEAAYANISASMSKLTDKVIQGMGTLEESAFEEFIKRDRLADAVFLLRDFRQQAANRMPSELEELAADLGVNGISAWSRLYFTTMGNISFHYVDPEEGEKDVPMAQLNSLLSNPNRDRRIAAAEGAAATFSEHQHTYAAAINAISGTRHALNKRRGIHDFLEPSLRQSRISHTTLSALISAIEFQLPFAREVFKFRTQCLSINDPGYVDLRAPLPLGDGTGPSWDDGVSLISSAFNSVYPALGKFFDEMIEKNWIDHTPREGKRPGGFCTGSLATRESRIFMTYKDTLNDVLTLAHEAGHAWHSRVLKDQRILAARYPMTLAESASTFAERVLTEGILSSDEYDKMVKLVLLDAEVEHMLAFLLDLPVRFRFEQAVYDRRAEGTLSATELCEQMSEIQHLVFGDTLAPGREDKWFWASKLHFYIEGVQFYNYPYTFGYLLSTAYLKRFREGLDGALNTYERFLSNSGKMSCEDVVMETLGEDITDPNFWSNLIGELRHPFNQYQEMLRDLSE